MQPLPLTQNPGNSDLERGKRSADPDPFLKLGRGGVYSGRDLSGPGRPCAHLVSNAQPARVVPAARLRAHDAHVRPPRARRKARSGPCPPRGAS
jgi:hypothetical protein